MGEVRKQLESLKQQLGDKESASKCAEADSENLQQVVSKMREEIMKVDANAEEFRKESSRFSAAASGAVDPELMLQRASEAEAKAKAEIGKREALRQSQDSLETQLENVRKITVKAETDANTIRRALAETNSALDQGEKLHKDLQDRFSAELGKSLSQWSGALKSSSDNMSSLALILQRFDQINSMILTEKEQKGLLRNVIGDLVNKLQRLQTNLAAE
jgi:chromosome segregation ATPase